MDAAYTYLWEFDVDPAHVLEFERHYGPGGTWAGLFRKSPAYLETVLLKDRESPGRYVTVDRWHSKGAYLAFRTEFATEYAALDVECEHLTLSERPLGTFCEWPP